MSQFRYHIKSQKLNFYRIRLIVSSGLVVCKITDSIFTGLDTLCLQSLCYLKQSGTEAFCTQTMHICSAYRLLY